MIFKVHLKTNLEVTEIVEKLNAVTEKFYTNSKNEYLFEGKISATEFQLFPTFDFGPRNQLRPEINGKIEKNENFCLIVLEYGIPNYLKIPLILIVILNLVFALFLFIKPINSFFTWKFFAFIIILTFIFFYLIFKRKTESSTKFIRQILEAEIIK